MKKFVKVFAALALGVALAACSSDDGTDPVDPTVVPVESVTLDLQTLPLKVGEKKILVATVLPADADNKAVTWKSSDESVAKVSDAGEVEALKAGPATITVTSVADKTKTATCDVTVTAAEEEEIVYVMPSSFIADQGNDEYTIVYAFPDGKITGFDMIYWNGNTEQETEIPFSVTYPAADKCEVSFEDPNDGAIKAIFTLNAAGYVESAVYGYDDGPNEFSQFKEASFEYDAATKMLKKVLDGDSEKVFEATYEGTEVKTIYTGNYDTFTVGSSASVNTCAIDPTYLFLFDLATTPDLLTLAAMCNLLPHSKYLPASLSQGGETADINVDTTEEGNLSTMDIEMLDFFVMYEY